MNYFYPIEEDWTKEEIVDVINFFNLVESAYEGRVAKDNLLLAYARYKQIVPSKSEEKAHFREFERGSTYAPYRAVQLAQKSSDKYIQLTKPKRK